nr:hypothetical protein Iba_chr07aCG6180 [Ipomoea batatas]
MAKERGFDETTRLEAADGGRCSDAAGFPRSPLLRLGFAGDRGDGDVAAPQAPVDGERDRVASRGVTATVTVTAARYARRNGALSSSPSEKIASAAGLPSLPPQGVSSLKDGSRVAAVVFVRAGCRHVDGTERVAGAAMLIAHHRSSPAGRQPAYSALP